MGLLDQIFPGWFGPEAKVARVRKLLDAGEYMEARWAIDGVVHPDAPALLARANQGLVELNLTAAEGATGLGDVELAAEHIALATEFGATPEQLRAARRRARDGRPKAPPPKAEPAPEPEGDDPIWSLPADDPRLRYAMALEGWPPELQPRLLALGAEFAEAVLAIDEGRASHAWQALAPFPAQDPVAHYERARAALAMGAPALAAGELLRFGEKVGHTQIGAVHTAALLGQALAQSGRAAEGLDPVEAALTALPDNLELRSTRASLLEATDRVDEAEAEVTAILRRAPKSMGLWRMLARLRLRRGERAGATAALEAALDTCCGSPGRCGSQPFDVETAGLLARMYAEDGSNPRRLAELEAKIQASAG